MSVRRATTKSASASLRTRQPSRTRSAKRRVKTPDERWPRSGGWRAKTDTPPMPNPDPPRG